MAERINKGVRSAEEAERHARVLQEIEAHIEGMEDVSAVSPGPTMPVSTSAATWNRAHGCSVFASIAVRICVLPHVCFWPYVPWPDDTALRGWTTCCSY